MTPKCSCCRKHPLVMVAKRTMPVWVCEVCDPGLLLAVMRP